ncbi:prepilin peptidase [Amycolatopsis samaneae]|uniref:Prepilin peptidase n=1 Tax=Amycolatopsis samaneae TaxID=664691 RepID=A0ABW5GKB8_9PSEU
MTALEHAVVGVGIGLALTPLTILIARATATAGLRRRHHVALAVTTAAAGAAVATWPHAAIVLGALVVVAGVPAATVDVLEHRIPNRLSLLLAVAAVLAVSFTAWLEGALAPWGRALAGGAIWGGLLLLSFLITATPGPGDVKLAPSLGMVLGWFGWTWLAAGIVLTYLIAALLGLAGVVAGRLRLRGGRIPLGPPMVAATLHAATAAALTQPH